MAAVAAVLLTSLAMVPAAADDTASRSTMAGPGSELDGMYLTYAGCEEMTAPGAAPGTRINLGPGTAPLGRRSFGIVPRGTGTASGPTHAFLSLAALGGALDVRSEAGTTGASYIWVTSLDAPPGQAWRGRAALSVGPATWQHVDLATVPYDWQLIDLTTGAVAASETSTPTDFVGRHGDGAGYVLTGFGCDGNAFNLDAVRAGGRTWDFEGLALSTSILSSSAEAVAGGSVTMTGSVSDASGRTMGDPLVLQSRVPGTTEWTDASPLTLADPDGFSHVEVEVTETREFRWLRPESEYADAGASEPVLVTVADPPVAVPDLAGVAG